MIYLSAFLPSSAVRLKARTIEPCELIARFTEPDPYADHDDNVTPRRWVADVRSSLLSQNRADEVGAWVGFAVDAHLHGKLLPVPTPVSTELPDYQPGDIVLTFHTKRDWSIVEY